MKIMLDNLAAEMRRDYLKRWRQNNPDKVREYNRQYWQRKADRAREEAKEDDQQANQVQN